VTILPRIPSVARVRCAEDNETPAASPDGARVVDGHRPCRSAPTGIDQVEYAYAKELLNVSETTGVFATPVFVGALRKSRVQR